MAPSAEDFNPDELVAPEWLNAEFFIKVLHECEKDNQIEVKSFKLTPGTGKGDHYASVMFRAVVDYIQQNEEKTISMIIKTMPETDGIKKDMLEESHLFKTEIAMYSEVIPKFEQILREVGDNTVLGARCLYHSLSPKQVIIFEDLVPQGYTVLRDRFVNMEEANVVYSKLAKWHAISYKLNMEDPSLLDKYRQSFLDMPGMEEHAYITEGCASFVEMLDTVPSLLKYKPYFEAIKPNLFKRFKQSYKEFRENPQENAFYVLCHGDFHGKNLMFKHHPETGKFEDAMLLDFQITFMGSIVNDLFYSEYMLIDEKQRTNNFDELIYNYFEVFVETLKKIGFEGRLPKLVELREQMTRHNHLEIYLLVSFLPLWYSFREAKEDLDDVLHFTDLRKSLYQNKSYIDELHTILPKMLHLGYFENW